MSAHTLKIVAEVEACQGVEYGSVWLMEATEAGSRPFFFPDVNKILQV